MPDDKDIVFSIAHPIQFRSRTVFRVVAMQLGCVSSCSGNTHPLGMIVPACLLVDESEAITLLARAKSDTEHVVKRAIGADALLQHALHRYYADPDVNHGFERLAKDTDESVGGIARPAPSNKDNFHDEE